MLPRVTTLFPHNEKNRDALDAFHGADPSLPNKGFRSAVQLRREFPAQPSECLQQMHSSLRWPRYSGIVSVVAFDITFALYHAFFCLASFSLVVYEAVFSCYNVRDMIPLGSWVMIFWHR